MQRSVGRRSTVSAISGNAATGNRRDIAGSIDLPDTVVGPLCNIKVAGQIHGNTEGCVELSAWRRSAVSAIAGASCARRCRNDVHLRQSVAGEKSQNE